MFQLKSFGQALLRQNFDATFTYHRTRLWLQGYNQPSKLLIYQMGKVASTSIFQALQAKIYNQPIYHIHYLSLDKLSRQLQTERKNFPKNRYILNEVVEADYIRQQLNNHPEQIQQWKIITLVRDPIGRRVSAFFQATEIPKLSATQQDDSEFIDDLVQSLVERFLSSWLNNASDPYYWFDSELKSSFGFDIFAHHFDQSLGYQIYRPINGPEILCIQLEKLNNCASEAFENFLGIRDLSLSKANVGSEKRYAVLYKKFKAALKLPRDFVEAMYNSAHVTHFYRPEEIAQFQQRW